MKNKEIEELLNELKEYASGGMSGLYPSEDTVKNFVSYIEQLEKEYNRSLDKLRNLRVENEQLENNRDKAIEYIEQCQLGVTEYDEKVMLAEEDEVIILLNILKGDSDE